MPRKTSQPDQVKLHAQQEKILHFIDAETRQRGYPPSVREICQAVNLKSPSSVHYHLKHLERLGLVQSVKNTPRSLRVTDNWQAATRAGQSSVERLTAGRPRAGQSRTEQPHAGQPRAGQQREQQDELRPVRHVPLLGDVSMIADVIADVAGLADTATAINHATRANDASVTLYPLPSDLTSEGELVMLRVNDESMTGAGILEGDYLVVELFGSASTNSASTAVIDGDLTNGDLVVAATGAKPVAVVRQYQSRGNTVWLQAAYPQKSATAKPAAAKTATKTPTSKKSSATSESDPEQTTKYKRSEVKILGRVVTVLRQLGPAPKKPTQKKQTPPKQTRTKQTQKKSTQR